VEVKFAGHFKFTVGYRATLRAIGTEAENIVLTAIDPNEGWFGIRFVNAGNDDVLQYCTIEHSRKPRTGGGGHENIMGGAILCGMSWDPASGHTVPSSPMIDHCLIAHNHAELGGAMMLTDYSEALVTNNRIVDNTADIGGAGIFFFYGGGTITNNIIAHNSAGGIGGGIMNSQGYPAIINNTIVQNRPSGLHLEMTSLDPWDPDYGRPVLNNIIWHNEIFMADDVPEQEYDIRFNDVQGGWQGEGNIEIDPLFADSEQRDYHLKSEAGCWDTASKSWVTDSVTSPCIDAGSWADSVGSEPTPNGNRINMGAYGSTAQASKSF
jgi:hypothetical protein